MGTSFPPNAVTGSSFTEFQSMITTAELKSRYLFGITMTDKDDNEIPEETFQHFINTAVSFLEHELDIIIIKRKFQENYDYRSNDYTAFNFLQLKKRPVNDLISLKARWPNGTVLIDYPEAWFVVEKEGAQIQLAPMQGSFSGLVVSQGATMMPMMFGTKDYWPHLFEATYFAGFNHDEIPLLLNEMIGMQAAIRSFEVLGDLLIPGGISSESVGMDGASVSKQTTASANYSVYSARITSYEKQMKKYIKTARKYYNGIPFTVA